MAVDKQKVLYDAPLVLNKPDQHWQVTVQGDSIVGHWKWLDAVFISVFEVTEAIKEYSFTVTLGDNGKYKELDRSGEKERDVSFSGGTLSFGSSSDKFMGKKNQKSFQFGLGADRNKDQVGVVVGKLDTTLIKEPIRQYLADCGWKKAGLFG